jgi:hypothetical protein
MTTKTKPSQLIYRTVYGDETEGLVRMATIDTDKHRAEFIISTETPVQDGWGAPRSLKTSGVILKDYRRNPVILAQHNHAPENVIARSVEVRQEEGRLVAVAEFDVEDEYAERVWGKIRRGFVKAASVGFVPIRERMIEDGVKDEATGLVGPVRLTTQWRLFEWSIVAVGADAESLGRSAEAEPAVNEKPVLTIPRKMFFIPKLKGETK